MLKLKLLRCLRSEILLCLVISLNLSCAEFTLVTPHPPDVFLFEYMTTHLATDPTTSHLMLMPSPTCMANIKEPECGHGVSAITGQEIFVGEAQTTWFKGKSWSKLKEESIYIPAVESYAPLEAYMIGACNKMKCNKELDAFRIKLNSLNGVAGAIQNH